MGVQKLLHLGAQLLQILPFRQCRRCRTQCHNDDQQAAHHLPTDRGRLPPGVKESSTIGTTAHKLFYSLASNETAALLCNWLRQWRWRDRRLKNDAFWPQ